MRLALKWSEPPIYRVSDESEHFQFFDIYRYIYKTWKNFKIWEKKINTLRGIRSNFGGNPTIFKHLKIEGTKSVTDRQRHFFIVVFDFWDAKKATKIICSPIGEKTWQNALWYNSIFGRIKNTHKKKFRQQLGFEPITTGPRKVNFAHIMPK